MYSKRENEKSSENIEAVHLLKSCEHKDNRQYIKETHDNPVL